MINKSISEIKPKDETYQNWVEVLSQFSESIPSDGFCKVYEFKDLCVAVTSFRIDFFTIEQSKKYNLGVLHRVDGPALVYQKSLSPVHYILGKMMSKMEWDDHPLVQEVINKKDLKIKIEGL